MTKSHHRESRVQSGPTSSVTAHWGASREHRGPMTLTDFHAKYFAVVGQFGVGTNANGCFGW